jgi:murein DD-endopeptidase MepM/ murein hydrolase activator NlpD
MTESTPSTPYPTRRSLRQQARRTPQLPKIRPAAAFAVLAIAGMLAGAAIPMVSSAAPARSHTARPQDAQSMRIATATNVALDRDTYTAKIPPKPVAPAPAPAVRAGAPAPAGKLAWPFGHPVPLSSLFGARSAPCSGCSSNHQGVDMIPGAGTPIMAAAPGTVREAEYGGALGNYVVIDHTIAGRRVSTMYAHMATLPLVSVGQTVQLGTVIGTVGNTGASTGPHLHFEVLLDGVTAVNPLPWLA